MSMTPNEILEAIIQLRKQKGYTQGYVAEKLGITPNMYGYYESGKSEITLQKLHKVLEILEIDFRDLLQIKTATDINLPELIKTHQQILKDLEEIQARRTKKN